MIAQYAIFAAAGVLAIVTITAMVAPQWRRILRLAAGRADEPVDRWRSMHMEADRRAPFERYGRRL